MERNSNCHSAVGRFASVGLGQSFEISHVHDLLLFVEVANGVQILIFYVCRLAVKLSCPFVAKLLLEF